MAPNSAHAFFTIGFLLLMASGSAAAALGTCEFASTTYRGRCQDDLICAAACHGERFKGDTWKPVIGGRCSDGQWLDGDDGRYWAGPRCICILDCGGKDKAEKDEAESRYGEMWWHHHHHKSPPPPPAEEPPAMGMTN